MIFLSLIFLFSGKIAKISGFPPKIQLFADVSDIFWPLAVAECCMKHRYIGAIPKMLRHTGTHQKISEISPKYFGRWPTWDFNGRKYRRIPRNIFRGSREKYPGIPRNMLIWWHFRYPSDIFCKYFRDGAFFWDQKKKNLRVVSKAIIYVFMCVCMYQLYKICLV